MTIIFHTIGIIGLSSHPKALATYKMLYDWLNNQGIHVIMEHQTAIFSNNTKSTTGSLTEIGHQADLAIIVGGDGNMLRAAKILSKHNIQIIGINRGNLGFLTDINPHTAIVQLSSVLSGKYISEKRLLLEAKIHNTIKKTLNNIAINEIILHSNNTTHMIEFEVFIDNNFTFSQRSDGLIIATPTGSTAYSLSAGGPILTPNVEAILLIPMLPHTLSSRPLIINSNSIICLKFPESMSRKTIKIYFDNQTFITLQKKENIFIQKSKYYLNLIHPNNYDYFKKLNIKLGWSKKYSNF